LGRAIAATLARRGATVVLSSRKRDELEQLSHSLSGSGHRIVVSDLADEGATFALLEEAGDIDALVANAALPASGKLTGFSRNEIDRALRVNLESPVHMTRELLPRWQARNRGHFVFVSSISGFTALPGASLYAATKFGLRGFALNLREDLRGSGVGVSVVTPGAIRDAGMFAESGAAPPPGLGTGTPEQVGEAVVRAIEGDKAEISVAPLRQRVLARVAMVMPEVVGRLSGSTAAKASAAVAAGQRDKR
jgi:short-subunit dehydrogenase